MVFPEIPPIPRFQHGYIDLKACQTATQGGISTPFRAIRSLRVSQRSLRSRQVCDSLDAGVLIGAEPAHLATHGFLLHLNQLWPMPLTA